MSNKSKLNILGISGGLLEEGFSLTELLIAASLSAITVIVAVQILGPHLRMNQRMEGYNRLQERWARLSYLLDTELQIARGCNPGVTPGASNQCGITTNLSTNTLTFYAPTSTTTGGSEIPEITYKQVGTQLLRDGPAITAWGRLDPASQQTNQLVVDGVVANSFRPSVTTTSVSYTLNLVDPNSDATFTGRSGAARGRADCLSLEADATPPSCD